ncbi:MAG: hypothetical protein WCQ49_01705 [Candidatus Saccharibacteria bacterium]
MVKDKLNLKKLNILMLLALPLVLSSVVGLYIRHTINSGWFSEIELLERFVLLSICLIIINHNIFKILENNKILSSGYAKFQVLSVFFFGIIYLAGCIFLLNIGADRDMDNYYSLSILMPIIALLPIGLFGLIAKNILPINYNANRGLVNLGIAVLLMLLITSLAIYYNHIYELRLWMCSSWNLCSYWPF